MDEKLYYLGFSLFPGIGPVLLKKLLTEFGSVKIAWKAQEAELTKAVGQKITEKFLAFRESTNLKNEYKKIVQNNIQLVALGDKEYPKILLELFDKGNAPFLLYLKGDVSILSAPKTIGIVGTRKITSYGREVTEMLTSDLVMHGFVVVSGLAFGVDIAAHMATVKNNGKTVAVLGCGVDCCNPISNQKVYDAILASGGAIVSAFPPGMEATVGSFPARNALIAGLSRGIVVTEGAADSGALITARDAKRFGRPVFAVPGPITSMLSKGANSLLKDGAVAVTDARDIIQNLKIDDNILKADNEKILSSALRFQFSREEQKVITLLENGPLHFDEIVRRIEKDSKAIGSLLSLMELKGMIKSSGSIYSH